MNFYNTYVTFAALLILFFLSACKNVQSVKNEQLLATFNYPDNKIYKQVYIIGGDTSLKRVIFYYKNGNKQKDFVEKNSIPYGRSSRFYPNGKIEESGDWIDGKKSGFFNYYDSLGNLEFTREFILTDLENKGYHLNRIYKFSNSGDTIKAQSAYFTISAPDTIVFGHEYNLNLYINAPIFRKAGFVVCDFDSKFNFPKSRLCDTILMSEFFGCYKTNNYQKGENIVRGIIYNYDEIIDSTGKGVTKGHYFYFVKKFHAI